MFWYRFGGPHLVGGGAVVEKSTTFLERLFGARESERMKPLRARRSIFCFFKVFEACYSIEVAAARARRCSFFCVLVPFVDLSRHSVFGESRERTCLLEIYTCLKCICRFYNPASCGREFGKTRKTKKIYAGSRKQ